jgi:predicted phage-related endonuclease
MSIDHQIEKLNSARLLGYFEHDSDAWHEARKGIAGSLISCLMGHNPWRSAYTAYYEYLEQLPRDSNGPSLAMRLGTFFEQPIKDFWLKENSEWITAVHNTGTWQSVTQDKFRANPDGFIEWADGSLSLLEIKFSRNPMNELPLHYYDQVMWYLHVLGLKKGLLVALANGELIEHEINYDPAYGALMEDYAFKFLRSIDTLTPPDWDGSTSTYETVRTLSAGIRDDEVQLGELYGELIASKENFDIANDAFTLVKSKVLALMDGAKNGMFGDERVITLQSRGSGGPFIVFKKG